MWASVWGQKVLHVRRIYAAFMHRFVRVLCPAFASLSMCFSVFEAIRTASRSGGAIGVGGYVVDTTSFLLCISVPSAEVLAEPDEGWGDCLGVSACTSGACDCELAVCV